MSGSISMSAISALRTGAGLVTAAVPDRCLETVAGYHPAVMTMPLADDGSGTFSLDAITDLAPILSSVDAIGCGPGMTTAAGSIRLVDRILRANRVPRVLDADAINVLPSLSWREIDKGTLVLTPHPGEFARLSGVSASDRSAQIDAAAALADDLDVVIVLKGGPTVVISRDQRWTNDTGNAGMATAGSGDVLTGVITSLLGQGLSGWDAARLGVWVHGRAGDEAAQQLGQPGMTAPDISAAIPHVMESLTGRVA
jgi:NAD(P)H-hydrate epimerase